jgi:hypothetical protein
MITLILSLFLSKIKDLNELSLFENKNVMFILLIKIIKKNVRNNKFKQENSFDIHLNDNELK